MKGKFLLSSIMLIILLAAAGTINAQTDSGTPPAVYGSGTLNYIPLFTGTSTIGNSVMYQGNSNIGIGTTSPISKLHINSGTQKMSFDKLDGSSLGYGRSYIGFNASRSSDESGVPWIVNGDGSNNGASVIWSNCVGNLYFAAIPTNNTIRGTSTTTTTMNYSDDNILSYSKMIIQSSGNVGIGTISPSHRLQVDLGNILIRGTNDFQNNGDEAILNLGDDNNYIKSIYGGGLRIGAYCSGSSQDVINISSSGNVGIGITDNLHAKLDINAGNSTGLYINTQQDSDYGYCIKAKVNRDNTKALVISKDGTENFVVYGNGNIYGNGNVGIGTNSPASKFQVVGNSVFTGTTESITAAAYIRGLNTHSTATTPDYTWYNYDQTGIFHTAGDDIGFTIGGTARMTINANGSVIIGNTYNQPANDYKLYVETGILSEKVKVLLATEWPDYVLDNNYKLQSLNEVEDYISIHKHLPDIPSATEVKDNGIELGEMNTLLMKKVEELTLYLIQQQKEIDALKNEISSLKK